MISVDPISFGLGFISCVFSDLVGVLFIVLRERKRGKK